MWRTDHDDIMTWKCCLHNWPFVRGIHQSLMVDSLHKGPVMQTFDIYCAVSALTFWRDSMFMMTSSNRNIFHITGPLCGNSLATSEFFSQRPVTWSFDVFFDPRLNKQLSKQSWGSWFEMPSCPLWRHCNVSVIQDAMKLLWYHCNAKLCSTVAPWTRPLFT